MTDALGIIMLDTKFPRIPGDIGNPATFSFPVKKKIVVGANPERVIFSPDPSLLQPFIQAAKELEAEGVRAITTSCGFLAIFQREIAAQLHVPVFTSSLLQARLVAQMLRPDQYIGILTISAKSLSERHFRGAGIENIKKVVYGLDGTHFQRVFFDLEPNFDREQAQEDVIAGAKRMLCEHPEVGSIVFECTNLPPYAHAVEDAVGVPVYDIVTLANYVMSGTTLRHTISS